MKSYFLTNTIVLAVVSFNAFAQAPSCQGSTRINDLRTLLPGKTVCASRDTEKWQEEHRGGPTSGQLWDYKMGPNDPIDPTEQVGTWSIVQQGQDFRRVTYTYGVESYTFEVHEPTAGVYNFCGIGVAENIIGATIQTNPQCP